MACFVCRYISSMRLSRIAVFFLLIFISVPPLFYFYANGGASAAEASTAEADKVKAHLQAQSDAARRTLGLISDEEWKRAGLLCPAAEAEMGLGFKKRLEEQFRVKQSVQVELRGLEKKGTELQKQVAALHRLIEDLKTEATRDQLEGERLRLSNRQEKLAQEEFTRRNTPEIRAPLSLQASLRSNVALLPPAEPELCGAAGQNCFDYSRCSLTSNFPIYVYDHESTKAFSWLLSGNFHLTTSPDRACVFLVFVEDASVSSKLSSYTNGLSHWNGDGRNHILYSSTLDLSGLKSRAMVAQPSFARNTFKMGFDIVTPFAHVEEGKELGEVWRATPDLLPLHRKYLVTFEGTRDNGVKMGTRESNDFDIKVLEHLKKIDSDNTDDRALIDYECSAADETLEHFALDGEIQLCHDEAERKKILMESTFVLVLAPQTSVSSKQFQLRLAEALRFGAIPVILGEANIAATSLPFSEQIVWAKATLIEPTARIPELHFLMRSFTDADLFAFRRQGNLIWRNYLATPSAIANTAMHVLRERLHLPPPITKDSPSPTAFEGGQERAYMDQLPSDLEPVEPLGPLEQPKPSVAFRRNFSTSLVDSYERWNIRFDAFFMAPYTPFEPILPTDAKFRGSFQGFRAVGEGAGGAGREFSQAIGGNVPSEQFTVVMLTYEREQVLIDSLVRLYGLPFLNKVIVVWNSELPPSPDLKWPDIGVTIEVIKTTANSLNNRFLPFDSIETEAVLSVDDDAHLRHDEIVFGFRVWRENRDRLVGFPGRFHAWDAEHNQWNYNSNYSCELSMVLTGAAFYHKYYNYAYSQVMPSAIRQLVDEYMNCEDIAMNFLISHMTRKPPVKVTSRWTFRCPGCPVSLWEDDSHFQERHKCINYFSRVFGYMPLLYTQFRADSVLFKTRIPADKQKCFKFI